MASTALNLSSRARRVFSLYARRNTYLKYVSHRHTSALTQIDGESTAPTASSSEGETTQARNGSYFRANIFSRTRTVAQLMDVIKTNVASDRGAMYISKGLFLCHRLDGSPQHRVDAILFMMDLLKSFRFPITRENYDNALRTLCGNNATLSQVRGLLQESEEAGLEPPSREAIIALCDFFMKEKDTQMAEKYTNLLNASSGQLDSTLVRVRSAIASRNKNQLFELLKSEDLKTISISDANALVKFCFDSKYEYGAVRLWKWVEALNLNLNVFSYGVFLHGFAQMRDEENVLTVMQHMVGRGFTPNVHHFTALIELYRLNKDLAKVESTLDSMRKSGVAPSAVTYQKILQTYRDANRVEKALETLSLMASEKVYPNQFHFRTVLSMAREVDNCDSADVLLGISRKYKIDLDFIAYNALITLYEQNGHLDKCFDLITEMKTRGLEPDVTTYTAMMRGSAQRKDYESVEKMLEFMKDKGVTLNEYTYGLVVRMYSELDNFDRAKKFYDLAVDAGILPSKRLLDPLIKAAPTIRVMFEYYRIMQLRKLPLNEKTEEALVTALSRFDIPISVADMHDAGVMPDETICTAVLEAAMQKENAALAVNVYRSLRDSNVQINTRTIQRFTSLYQNAVGASFDPQVKHSNLSVPLPAPEPIIPESDVSPDASPAQDSESFRTREKWGRKKETEADMWTQLMIGLENSISPSTVSPHVSKYRELRQRVLRKSDISPLTTVSLSKSAVGQTGPSATL
eukprot:Colp12_sorted_trinity150504_noHs@35437